LYNLPGLVIAVVVIVVEGEKCADALMMFGFVATTSPMGAGKSGLADWSPLRGKTVFIWPDHDGPGHKHADDLSGILFGLGCTVYRVDPAAADLAEKEDAADFVDQCKVLEYTDERITAEIQAVLDKARPIRPSGGLMDGLNAIIDGTAEPAPLPQFRTLVYLSRPLIPKNSLLVCGPPGAGKSFFLMQILLGWVDAGYPFAAIMLEDDKPYHLHRALAQLEGQAVYFDRDFIKANPEQVRAAYARHADTLDALAVGLWDMPKSMMSYANLLDWSRDRLKDGARVLAIDPITIIQQDSDPWIADKVFLDGFKRLLIEHNAAGLIVTHPKKGITKPCLDDLSGGAAWQRFAHAIIWIDEKGGKMRIKTACGEIDTTVNRTVHICKARNGRGHGVKLGYIFRELLFAEQGVITGRAKGDDDGDE
jgi:KaiC/GvpD/RAD55 family RecA-like ATPase